MKLKLSILFVLTIVTLFLGCKKEKIDLCEDYQQDNPMLHAEGEKIVNAAGEQIILKGTIPLGWIQWEGTVWNVGFNSEQDISARLIELVGEAEFNSFRDSIQANFITEADIEAMATFGFNCVRIPFNHTLLEEDDNPYVYKQAGWDILDDIIDWCELYNVYVVLDLHSAPGGQSGLFTADPDKTKLFNDEENINRTVALWEAIASRYKNREIIAGYDVLNEPDISNNNELIKFYEKAVKAIRKVDPYHLIFIEGNNLATDFDKLDKPFSLNMAWSFHTYDLFGSGKSEEHLEEVSENAEKTNSPIWNGEFGANSLDWTEKTVNMFDNNDFPVSGWIFWPWKRIPSDSPADYRHLVYFNPGPNWDAVSDYLKGGAKPNQTVSALGLSEFISACKYENCSVDNEVMAILN